jgi:hypothetical protein
VLRHKTGAKQELKPCRKIKNEDATAKRQTEERVARQKSGVPKQPNNSRYMLRAVYRPWPSAHAPFDASVTVHSLRSGGVMSAIGARHITANVAPAIFSPYCTAILPRCSSPSCLEIKFYFGCQDNRRTCLSRPRQNITNKKERLSAPF